MANNDVQRNDEKKWEDSDDEEALSLCDLPLIDGGDCLKDETRDLQTEDFDFCSWGGDPLLMCAADDVFFQGQILPLRPSVSSDSGLYSGGFAGIRQDSRSGSDSMDHSSGFNSSVRSSSTSSSSSMRSGHRKCEHRIANKFYAHVASPKPHEGFFGGGRPVNVVRKGRSSAGWGLFRLGLVKTPEIELQDLKLRRRNSSSSGNSKSNKNSSYSKKSNDEREVEDEEKKKKKKEKGQRFLFFRSGLSCKCSVNAVDSVSSQIVIVKKSKGDELGLETKQRLSHRRTFEWLKELSIAEAPEA